MGRSIYSYIYFDLPKYYAASLGKKDNSYIEIAYYILKPNNDTLRVEYSNYNVSEIQMSEGYDIYPTNLSQVRLNKPPFTSK